MQQLDASRSGHQSSSVGPSPSAPARRLPMKGQVPPSGSCGQPAGADRGQGVHGVFFEAGGDGRSLREGYGATGRAGAGAAKAEPETITRRGSATCVPSTTRVSG